MCFFLDFYINHFDTEIANAYIYLQYMFGTYHSIACSNPSPLTADVLKIAHVLFLSADSPKAVETSEGLIAPSIS